MQASRSLVLALLVAAAASRATAATAPEQHGPPEFALPAEAAVPTMRTAALDATERGRSALAPPGWQAAVDPRTGNIRAAWGPGIRVSGAVANDGQAERLARDFLLTRGEVLRILPEQMVLRNVRRAGGKIAVWFRQEAEGLRLRGAEAFVLLTESGRIAAFGSTFRDITDVEAPRIDAGQAAARATASIGVARSGARSESVEPWLVLAPRGELLVPVRAWRVEFESREPFGRWESFVDARDGSILSRKNLYEFINVVGSAQVRAEGLGYCGPETVFPADGMEVAVSGGSTGVVDPMGNFVVPHAGALPVLVTAGLRGPYVDVNREPSHGPDASFLGPATPGIPFNILFDDSNSLDDERDAFRHTNVAREFLRTLDPTMTGLDYPMPTLIRAVSGVCPGNAWWDGIGMNFCDGDITFANAARMETIISHEYGHAVTSAVYGRNGTTLSSVSLGEGNSDVYANFIARSNIVGKGWFTNDCNSFLRDSQNNLIYPDDLIGGSGHADGRIIAGFHWDVWSSLLLSTPPATADSVAFRTWYLGRDLGTPQDMPSQVLWTFLADDDDGDLGDGTPNFDHICLGALNHGFECPEPSSQVVITHTRQGHVTDGSSAFDVVATIVSTTAALDPASLLLHYRVNGRAFQSALMTPAGGADQFTAQIPPQGPMSQIEYYVSAADEQDHSAASPAAAPQELHAFDVAWLYDDVESGAGWTAGAAGDDAAYGAWGQFDPVGTLAQPEDDGSPLAGQTKCFITGQCAAGHGTCWAGCNLGCNDVDGGTTTLLSPVYDVTGAGSATLKYDRWYSNDTAAFPGEDFWVVDVSNDGGTTWTNVENTNVSDAAWRSQSVDLNALFGAPGMVRIRFRASDGNNPSLVEAGVDEVRILAAFGAAVAAAEPAGLSVTRLELAQNRPNPGRSGTEIEYALPGPTAVRLSIYDVRGRSVRELATGRRAAGRHTVRWDGRDGAGQRVAPGVYFYRLATDQGNLTRKMTVAP